MHPETTRSGGDPADSLGERRQATEADHQLDRRGMIRGVGAVLVASALVGCNRDDGGSDGGGGGGDYSVDDRAVSDR